MNCEAGILPPNRSEAIQKRPGFMVGLTVAGEPEEYTRPTFPIKLRRDRS